MEPLGRRSPKGQNCPWPALINSFLATTICLNGPLFRIEEIDALCCTKRKALLFG